MPGLRDSLGPVASPVMLEKPKTKSEKTKKKADVGAEADAEEIKSYDPVKRDPQYAHAESSPLWELVRPLPFPSLSLASTLTEI